MSEEELDIFDEKVKSDAENEEEQPAEQVPGDIYDKEFDNIDELLKGVEDGDVTEKRVIKKRKISHEGVQQEHKQQQKRTNSKKEEERELMRKKINEEVTQIKSVMEKYHKRDIKLVEDKLPALTKVKHIDEIIEKLSKQGVQREFIEQRGLDYLTNWLDKIPNGPEPSVSLRKKLLQFILELPIQRQHFQGIRLGKVIYKISSKSDVKELRNLATKVVEKWSKILNSRERNDDLDYPDDER